MADDIIMRSRHVSGQESAGRVIPGDPACPPAELPDQSQSALRTFSRLSLMHGPTWPCDERIRTSETLDFIPDHRNRHNPPPMTSGQCDQSRRAKPLQIAAVDKSYVLPRDTPSGRKDQTLAVPSARTNVLLRTKIPSFLRNQRAFAAGAESLLRSRILRGGLHSRV